MRVTLSALAFQLYAKSRANLQLNTNAPSNCRSTYRQWLRSARVHFENLTSSFSTLFMEKTNHRYHEALLRQRSVYVQEPSAALSHPIFHQFNHSTSTLPCLSLLDPLPHIFHVHILHQLLRKVRLVPISRFDKDPYDILHRPAP